MTRIINNTELTLTPGEQQAIHNGCAHLGLDVVKIADPSGEDFITVVDEDDNYLFHMRLSTLSIFHL